MKLHQLFLQNTSDSYVWNLLKINMKDTRVTLLMSLLLILAHSSYSHMRQSIQECTK